MSSPLPTRQELLSTLKLQDCPICYIPYGKSIYDSPREACTLLPCCKQPVGNMCLRRHLYEQNTDCMRSRNQCMFCRAEICRAVVGVEASDVSRRDGSPMVAGGWPVVERGRQRAASYRGAGYSSSVMDQYIRGYPTHLMALRSQGYTDADEEVIGDLFRDDDQDSEDVSDSSSDDESQVEEDSIEGWDYTPVALGPRITYNIFNIGLPQSQTQTHSQPAIIEAPIYAPMRSQSPNIGPASRRRSRSPDPRGSSLRSSMLYCFYRAINRMLGGSFDRN